MVLFRSPMALSDQASVITDARPCMYVYASARKERMHVEVSAMHERPPKTYKCLPSSKIVLCP